MVLREARGEIPGPTHMVILLDSHPHQQWLRKAVEYRLREELAKVQVEVNEEKSGKVDLERGESFGFLRFEFRRVRSRRGRWMPLLLPKGKKRTGLLGKLKEIFRASRSQPVGGVIEKINPILRGWVKYFAIGHSSRCFSYIRYWVERRSDAIWPGRASVKDVAGSVGAGNGCTERSDSSRSIGFPMGSRSRQALRSDRSHNP